MLNQWLTWIVVAVGLASSLLVLTNRTISLSAFVKANDLPVNLFAKVKAFPSYLFAKAKAFPSYLFANTNKSDADILFAIFCASVAMAMLRPNLEAQSGWLLWLVTLGSCATCNMYWLCSRALFRGEGAVKSIHIATAFGIALLIVTYRVIEGLNSGATNGWTAAFGALLTLASSTVLVLAFTEALRDWSPALAPIEKRLRIMFMLVFGSCVLLGTVTSAIAEISPEMGVLRHAVACACALLIIAFTHHALHIRRQHPCQRVSAEENLKPAADTKPEDLSLAAAIRQLLELDQLFRQPELKVSDLAERLNNAEYRVSRVITQVLGERNFNQLINRYRIAHACTLLEAKDSTQSVLEISLECGFASLGPFNRAFKAAMGCTPSAHRAAKRASHAVATPPALACGQVITDA